MSTGDLVPTGVPDSRVLVLHLRARLDEMRADLLASQGKVVSPEDVFPSVLSLTAAHERLSDYSAAFASVAADVLGYVQDDLEAAVGEQDGVPISGLQVPAPDGTTVAVELDTTAAGYSFTLESLLTSVVAEASAWWGAQEARGQALKPEVVLRHALDLLLTLGTFSPKVTKVREFAKEVARADPKAASTIAGAITKGLPKFKGVKVKRIFPK